MRSVLSAGQPDEINSWIPRLIPTDYNKYSAGHPVLLEGHSTMPASSDRTCAASLPQHMVIYIQKHGRLINVDNHHMHHANITGNPTNPTYLGNEDKPINQLVRGYAEMVKDRVDDGWSCPLLTFLFSQLPGPRPAVVSRMKDEVHRVYSTFLTRIHRKPRAASPDELPVLIAAADLPVFKWDRTSSPKIYCNGGLHFHGLLLTPPRSRLADAVGDHFRLNERHYLGHSGIMTGIHIEPVTSNHGYVVEYAFKTLSAGRVAYDDGVFILPRAVSELDPGISPICQMKIQGPSSDRVH
jgi:hypothetical protein